MSVHICHSKTMSHMFEFWRYWIHTNIIHITITQNLHKNCMNLWNLVSMWCRLFWWGNVSYVVAWEAHHKLHGSQFGNNCCVKFIFHRFVRNRHECYMFICVVYTQKSCTWLSCLNNMNLCNNRVCMDLGRTHEAYKFVMHELAHGHDSVMNVYNKMHDGYRVKVEWGIRGLKRKWRQLMKHFDSTKDKYNNLFLATSILINLLQIYHLLNFTYEVING